jgi:hypothetical protein
MQKKRIITSYEKLTPEVLDALKKQYPHGYADAVIKVDKGSEQFFHAIPVETDDTSYLVKVQVNIDKLDDIDSLPFDEEEEPINEEFDENTDYPAEEYEE